MRSVKPRRARAARPASALAQPRPAGRRWCRTGTTTVAPGSSSATAAACSMSPTPQPPPRRARPGRRRAGRARRAPGARPGGSSNSGRESPRTCTHARRGPAMAATSAARLRVDDQVQVDAGMRPEAQRREVGDRADTTGTVTRPSGAARPRSRSCPDRSRRRRRARRAPDEPQQRRAADAAREPAHQPARRPPADDQPVLQVEQRAAAARGSSPRRAEDRARTTGPISARPSTTVTSRGRASRSPSASRRGRRSWPGADVGGDDENARHVAHLGGSVIRSG